MVLSHYSITGVIRRVVILYMASLLTVYMFGVAITGVFAVNYDSAYESGTDSQKVDWCGGGFGDFRSYCRRNCTSYVAYKLAAAGVASAHFMNNGHGKDWYSRAVSKGIPIGSMPKVGAVVYWTSGGGGYGHVAWVDSVNADGTVNTSNYNGLTEEFYKQTSARPEGYIYFSNVGTSLNKDIQVGNSDVDANGAADLVLTTNEPTGGTGAMVALSTWQGFIPPQKWLNASSFGWSGVTPLVGDVTGDKVADYVFVN